MNRLYILVGFLVGKGTPNISKVAGKAGLQIRNANSHDCEKLRSEANSLRFASHKMDSTSLRFRFAIFRMLSLSLRFRNLNRLRIRREKSAKILLFPGIFFCFFPALSHCCISLNSKYSFENNNVLRKLYKSVKGS